MTSWWNYKGLTWAVLAVAAIGLTGSVVGERWPLVPVSGFGNAGEWLAAAAGLALIQAARIEAAERANHAAKQAEEAKRESVAITADRAYELILERRSWWTGPSAVFGHSPPPSLSSAPLVRALRSLARQTGCSALSLVADCVRQGGFTVSLPATYELGADDGSTRVWDLIYEDLIETVEALGHSEAPPAHAIDRFHTLAHEVPYFRARRTQLSRIEALTSGRLNVVVGVDTYDGAELQAVLADFEGEQPTRINELKQLGRRLDRLDRRIAELGSEQIAADDQARIDEVERELNEAARKQHMFRHRMQEATRQLISELRTAPPQPA